MSAPIVLRPFHVPPAADDSNRSPIIVNRQMECFAFSIDPQGKITSPPGHRDDRALPLVMDATLILYGPLTNPQAIGVSSVHIAFREAGRRVANEALRALHPGYASDGSMTSEEEALIRAAWEAMSDRERETCWVFRSLYLERATPDGVLRMVEEEEAGGQTDREFYQALSAGGEQIAPSGEQELRHFDAIRPATRIATARHR